MNFLSNRQNTILSAAVIISGATGLNAILGFVKGRILLHYFGISNDLTVFFTADRIPSLLYSVLVLGAVSTIFIPVFTENLKKNKEQAYSTASSIINGILLFFLILGFFCFVFSDQLMALLSFGKLTANEITLGSALMKIMIASQMLMVLGSLFTSILQSYKYFIIPAIAPLVYNIGMIVGTVLFSNQYGIYGPVYGVVIGSILFALIQLPFISKTGFIYKLNFNLKDKSLHKTFSLIPPRVLNVIISQLIGTLNNSMALLISIPSPIFLKYALQLQVFPANFVGLSIATASLPILSELDADNEKEKFKNTLLTTFHQMMYLVIPASIILLVLRVPMVRIVYGVANFPWEATVKTATILGILSISIFSQSAYFLFSRAFYSLKDTFTPVKVSLLTGALNLILSAYFIIVLKYDVWALALSYTLTSLLDFVLLFILLSKKLGGFKLDSVLKPFFKISLSGILMGFMLYIPVKLLDQIVFDTTRTINLLFLTGIAGISGVLTYLLITWYFKVHEIQLFYKLLRKLKLDEALGVSHLIIRE